MPLELPAETAPPLQRGVGHEDGDGAADAGEPPPRGFAAGLGALGLAMVFFQVGNGLAKGLFAEAGVQGTAALRIGLTAVILAVVFRPWQAVVPDRRSALALIGYGTALGLMILANYEALSLIPLGAAVALEFVGPLIVALASSRRWLDAVWAVMAAFGIVLLSPLGASVHALAPGGVALALGAGACWAAYIVFGKRAGAEHGGRAVALGAAVAAVVVVPFGVAEVGHVLTSPVVMARGLLVALLSGAVPYCLEMASLRRLPTRAYGVLTSLEPVLAALVGVVLLHEDLAPREWLGLVLIVSASVGATAALRHRP